MYKINIDHNPQKIFTQLVESKGTSSFCEYFPIGLN